jgi:signal peptidase I
VDGQLLLWKDSTLSAWVPLDEAANSKGPLEKDLEPVSILGTGVGLTISDLVLRRDIYYTRRSQASDYFRPTVGAVEMDAFLRDPGRWKRLREIAPQAEPWKLGDGEYIALGDNSLQSNDSRHWRQGPIVEEKMILGRAEWFLWPVSAGRSLRIR